MASGASAPTRRGAPGPRVPRRGALPAAPSRRRTASRGVRSTPKRGEVGHAPGRTEEARRRSRLAAAMASWPRPICQRVSAGAAEPEAAVAPRVVAEVMPARRRFAARASGAASARSPMRKKAALTRCAGSTSRISRRVPGIRAVVEGQGGRARRCAARARRSRASGACAPQAYVPHTAGAARSHAAPRHEARSRAQLPVRSGPSRRSPPPPAGRR